MLTFLTQQFYEMVSSERIILNFVIESYHYPQGAKFFLLSFEHLSLGPTAFGYIGGSPSGPSSLAEIFYSLLYSIRLTLWVSTILLQLNSGNKLHNYFSP